MQSLIEQNIVPDFTAEVLVIQLNRGVKNFVYYYIVVQAGLGFDVDAGATLYLTVAAEATVEVVAEIAMEIAAELAAEIATEIAAGLGYCLQI